MTRLVLIALTAATLGGCYYGPGPYYRPRPVYVVPRPPPPVILVP